MLALSAKIGEIKEKEPPVVYDSMGNVQKLPTQKAAIIGASIVVRPEIDRMMAALVGTTMVSWGTR